MIMSGYNGIELADAFGVHPDLVPFIPELLDGLWSLGVPTDVIVELLRPLNLPARLTKALDLGCGKGAVAIDLARELGFNVTGIDFYQPFIDEARLRAVEMGVGESCRFILGDIRETARKSADFDVVILVWVGRALGDLANSVNGLRRQVISGGYMVIAAGYLKEGTSVDLGHGEHVGRGESLRQLTAHGDTILREATVPEDRIETFYIDYLNSLRRGGQKVSVEHPELKHRLLKHIEKQERMCAIMKAAIVPAVWLIRRAG